MQEFKTEFNTASNQAIDAEKATAEFGDLLFSLVNYARFVDNIRKRRWSALTKIH